VFIGDVVNSGAVPSLELTLRFAGQRQRLLAHNIANWTTPNFRPLDVSPAGFQRALGQAIDQRREETGGASGELSLGPTPELTQGPGGGLSIVPRTPSAGILAQDRNNSDLETLMKDHAENAMVFRVASELLRSRLSQLRDAIAERV
jgi:flagellar basal-body rod protein FlgB